MQEKKKCKGSEILVLYNSKIFSPAKRRKLGFLLMSITYHLEVLLLCLVLKGIPIVASLLLHINRNYFSPLKSTNDNRFVSDTRHRVLTRQPPPPLLLKTVMFGEGLYCDVTSARISQSISYHKSDDTMMLSDVVMISDVLSALGESSVISHFKLISLLWYCTHHQPRLRTFLLMQCYVRGFASVFLSQLSNQPSFSTDVMS